MSSEAVKIRIGVRAARELELEVADADAFVKSFEKAVGDGESVLWVEDVRGRRHGLIVSSIVFVEVDRELEGPGVGFG